MFNLTSGIYLTMKALHDEKNRNEMSYKLTNSCIVSQWKKRGVKKVHHCKCGCVVYNNTNYNFLSKRSREWAFRGELFKLHFRHLRTTLPQRSTCWRACDHKTASLRYSRFRRGFKTPMSPSFKPWDQRRHEWMVLATHGSDTPNRGKHQFRALIQKHYQDISSCSWSIFKGFATCSRITSSVRTCTILDLQL